MKFFKLVKSLDYVSYPAIIELKKINKSLGDSYDKVKDIFVAALISILFDATPLSSIIIDVLSESTCAKVRDFSKWDSANVVLAVALAVIILCIFSIVRFIRNRWGSNKNTVAERSEMAFEFYKVLIPEIISIKSLLEQHNDVIPKDDYEKKFLILLQAKYELCEVIRVLSGLDILEVDKYGCITKSSNDVLSQIGKEAYFAVLKEILNEVRSIYDSLLTCEGQDTNDTVKSLRATVLSARPFIECKKAKDYCRVINKEYEDIQTIIMEDSAAV